MGHCTAITGITLSTNQFGRSLITERITKLRNTRLRYCRIPLRTNVSDEIKCFDLGNQINRTGNIEREETIQEARTQTESLLQPIA